MDKQRPQEFNVLAKRAMDGDEDAFNQLYLICFDIASRYSCRLPGHIREEFIRDMCQRLTTCIIKKRWEDTGTSFEAWIHGTAKNAVREWRKTLEKRSAEIQDPEFVFEDVEDNNSSTEGQILQEEENGVLWMLVSKLPKIQERIIYERYAFGRSFFEIGELVGKTEENCRQLHRRALSKLKGLANACGYFPEKK